jgi:hypothetical protein
MSIETMYMKLYLTVQALQKTHPNQYLLGLMPKECRVIGYSGVIKSNCRIRNYLGFIISVSSGSGWDLNGDLNS